MIVYIKSGDVFQIPGVRNYAHGCNCAGAMGKGIALQFRKKFPEMYKQYKALCLSGEFEPGSVFDYNYGDGHVFNLGTQTSWRSKAELPFLESSFQKMMECAINDGVSEIALPAIGAGLGGLDWNEVKRVLEEVSMRFPAVKLYVVENYGPLIVD